MGFKIDVWWLKWKWYFLRQDDIFFDDAWDNPFELMTEIDFDSDN